VKAALPDMVATSVVFPGSPFGSPYHYVVWTKGRTPLTSRLFSPVLVNPRSGALVSVVSMPWYLRVLEISRPLHFGDYGGMRSDHLDAVRYRNDHGCLAAEAIFGCRSAPFGSRDMLIATRQASALSPSRSPAE